MARLRTECATHASALLDRDPADSYHALTDESQFEEVQKIAAKVG
ncbi:hypothetical protein [Amycolatopsis sp. cmx-4-83]